MGSKKECCCGACNVCTDNRVWDEITIGMSGWTDFYHLIADACSFPFEHSRLICAASALNSPIACTLVREWSTKSKTACCLNYYGAMTFGDFIYNNSDLCPTYAAYNNEANWARGPNTIGFLLGIGYFDSSTVTASISTLTLAPEDQTISPSDMCNVPGKAIVVGSYLDNAFFCSGGDSDDMLASPSLAFNNSNIRSYDSTPGGTTFGPFSLFNASAPNPTSVILTPTGSRVRL